ncbi:hypothetical protein KTH81_15750 [Lachnospiraceae bacterium ASD3451]|uniref:hypothetical protein n=1 Tax=Diplocloster agilis TaxID=2850323 RepID=UPI001D2A0BDC|nr:hypothetical protein [Diplocloster agilis]MBU9745274.1 hypothetical protein [Diplocloster agilis]
MKIYEFIQLVLSADPQAGDIYETVMLQLQLYFGNPQLQIRVYVDNSPNFGHQATTIHILRRFLRLFRPRGAVNVLYDIRRHEGERPLIDKLEILVEMFDKRKKGTQSINFEGQQVWFTPFDPDKASLPLADFGFTGGYDNPFSEMPKILAVDVFLRLEPYNWHRPSMIEWLDDAGEYCSWRLQNVYGVYYEGFDLFQKMAYAYDQEDFMLQPAALAWFTHNIPNPNIQSQSAMALDLISRRGNQLLWPVYGFHTLAETGTIPVALLNYGLAALYYASLQQKPVLMVILSKFSRPAAEIACLLNDFREQDEEAITGYARNMNSLFYDADSRRKEGNALRELLRQVQAAGLDLSMIKIAEQVTPAVLQNIFADTDIALHVLFLGDVVEPLFRGLFIEADMPPVFEGQGTASFMISWGRPYLHFNGSNNGDQNNYDLFHADIAFAEELQEIATNPTIPVSQPTQGRLYTGLERIHNLLHFFIYCHERGNQYTEFFDRLAQLMGEMENDKLMMGMVACFAYLEDRVEGAVQAAYRTSAPLTLQEVLKSFTQAAMHRPFSLYDCLPDSNLTSYLRTYLEAFHLGGEGLQVTPAYDDDGELIRVVVSDAGTELYGIPMVITLGFEHFFETGDVTAALSCRSREDWEFLPWIKLSNIGFDLQIPENAVPVWGGITATYTDIRFLLQYPVINQVWVLSAVWDKPFSALTVLCRLAGNLDFMEILPAPLRDLAGIGAKEISLSYDTREHRLQSVMIRLEAGEAWTFCEEPELSILPGICITVTDPGSFEQRGMSAEITGQITLENEGRTSVLEVWARFPEFRAGLSLGSEKLILSDLLKILSPDIKLPESFEVSVLQMELDLQRKNWQFGCYIDMDWEVLDIFTVTGLGLSLQHGGSNNAAMLAGSVDFLPDGPMPIAVSVTAGYTSENGWKFKGEVTNGQQVQLSAVLSEYIGKSGGISEGEPDFPLCRIEILFESNTSRWRISAASQEPWVVPFIENLSVEASVSLGTIAPEEHTGLHGAVIQATAKGAGSEFLQTASPGSESALYAYMWAHVVWSNIDLTLWYRYAGPKGTYGFGLTCEGIGTAMLEKSSEEEGWKADIRFQEGVTLGSILCRMISWATNKSFGLEAPWNVLDAISPKNFHILYYFKTNQVALQMDIDPIDLGIAKISGIRVEYHSGGGMQEKGVFITIDGSFAWMQGDSINWNAAKPGSAPAPDGSGSSSFILRTLAAGQHIGIEGLAQADTVEKAMLAINTLEPPKGEKLPPVAYSSEGGWLIAADFGILKSKGEKDYMVDAQIVFCDPVLYALRLRLNGAAAKVFKGLDIQVLYRKVSDTIGVFRMEVTLPDTMRYLTVGAYSLTLPVFGLAVYTNGDYQVDIGFPWNQDFGRSLAVEGIIYPFIPITGAAGIYFGSLSDETAGDLIPHSEDGLFQPVITFGFGIRAGFGKSVHYGILNAGFSLTIMAIIEGVLAKWNPYPMAELGVLGDEASLDTDYYYKLTGIAGISGQLFGSVDFAIIKAEVNVSLSLYVQFTFEAYRAVVLSVAVGVEVELSVSINLGIFKIRIHFSFSLKIKESFSLGSDSKGPWELGRTPYGGLQMPVGRLQGPAGTRLSRLPRREYSLQWNRLRPSGEKQCLTGYISASLTAAADEWGSGSVAPCMVILLLLDTTLPASKDRDSAVRKALGSQPDTAFERLTKMIGRWLAAALQDQGDYSPGEADGLVITKEALDWAIDYGLASSRENPMPLPPDAVKEFLEGQFLLQIGTGAGEDAGDMREGQSDGGHSDGGHSDGGQVRNGVYFPVPGELSMRADDGEGRVTSYEFGAYNEVSWDKVYALRELFDELAVKVQKERDPVLSEQVTGSPLSMSEWVFADYFLLLARQMAQAMSEQLRNYQYPLTGQESARDIISWIRERGGPEYTLYDLLTANQEHPLGSGISLAVAGREAYTVSEGDTVQSIIREQQISAQMLSQPENDTIHGLFAAAEGEGAELSLPHLEQLRLAEVLMGVQRSRYLQHLSGMASRYHMHGLRIPADGISPAAEGMWVKRQGTKLCLPEEAGMYALTGQQIALLPDIRNEFKITFDCSTVPWMECGSPLEIILSPGSPKAGQVKWLMEAAAYPGELKGAALQPQGLADRQAASYSFTNPYTLTAADPVVLPYAGSPVSTLYLYELPEEAVMGATAGKPLMYRMSYARYDEAEGEMAESPGVNYGWGTRITFRIRKSPGREGYPMPNRTYDLAGMGQKDVAKLERILSVEEGGLPVSGLLLGYFEKDLESSAMISEGNAVSFWLQRSNLSTETHPAGNRIPGAAPEDTSAFFRCLWEGCITNSGGYSLYYRNEAKDCGLPDEIFDDKGNASVNLFVLYDRTKNGCDAKTEESCGVFDYMNLFVTGCCLEEGTVPLGKACDGRVMLNPTVTAGVLKAGAVREVPADVEEITCKADAMQYLLNNYSLLSYRILENDSFMASPSSMPIGPAPGNLWQFTAAVPYRPFLKYKKADLWSCYQDGESPYVGIGETLRLEGWWQDLYGNRIVSRNVRGLKEAAGDITVGYVDRLIPPDSWPGITYDWRIAEEGSFSHGMDPFGASPVLVFTLRFDGRRYDKAEAADSAKQAFARYGEIYYQLTDPNPVRLELATSLLKEDRFLFGEEEREALNDWLFAQEDSVCAYLKLRAQGKEAAAPQPCEIAFPFHDRQTAEQQLFGLYCRLHMHRTKEIVPEELTEDPAILTVSTEIPPCLELVPGLNAAGIRVGEEAGRTRDMSVFARNLEHAFPGMRVLCQEKQPRSESAQLWIFRQGDRAAEYRFREQPVICAVRPPANRLMDSGGDIGIYSYVPGQGLSPSPDMRKEFRQINLDDWLRLFVRAFDDLLEPGMLSAIFLADPDAYEELLNQKRSLADSLAGLLMPVFADQGGSSAMGREILRQQLLNRLTSLYGIRAVLEYKLAVQAMINENIPPRLYGSVTLSQTASISITDARFALETAQNAGMAFCVQAPELLRNDQGGIISEIEGELIWQPSWLEHQIHSLPNIANYHGSSWLGNVTGPDEARSMGRIRIPMLLRSYPDMPVMVMQEQAGEDRQDLWDLPGMKRRGRGDGLQEGADLQELNGLQELLLWNYIFTYSLPYHYPQDEIWCTVYYNQTEVKSRKDELQELFTALARFATVYPQMRNDLDIYVARLSEGADYETAKKIINSFCTLSRGVTEAAVVLKRPAAVKNMPGFRGSGLADAETAVGNDPAGSYSFMLREGSYDGEEGDEFAIGVFAAHIPGLPVPEVGLTGEDYETVRRDPAIWGPDCAGLYTYRDKKTGKGVTVTEGQSVTKRSVTLQGLNILKYQNALAGTEVIRNRDLIPGREIAEEFIYDTGEVRFDSPYFASREIKDEIDLASFGQKPGIAGRLTAFFNELLTGCETCEMKVEMEARYSRVLGGGLEPIELPVCLQLPLPCSCGEAGLMAVDWEKEILSWYQLHIGDSIRHKGSNLHFDITLFTSYTPQPRQLLHFPNLILDEAEL